MNVAIIPARGGSKRIPGKNIKNFAGKPIIHYSIKAAIESGLFTKVIVSTDSEEIADVAIRAGAEVPFMRPMSLSDDTTPTAPVLEHAINWLNDHGEKVKYCCCIYATAPFVTSKSIKDGFSLLSQSGASSVFTAATFESCIFRGLRITEDGLIKMLWPENELKRSQDFEDVYHDAGQLYWLDSEKFLENKTCFSEKSLPLILPRYLVQDIDTAEDWETAELIFEVCKNKKLL
ncbi:MAG TPA: pseudaminic acid cytidylyltransferase [Phycisphaerales bacterium]|nr:pseudaminic acid cytidylyltransferase [Phycisphaerales bacterium]